MISASASSWTTVRTTGSTRSTLHRYSAHGGRAFHALRAGGSDDIVYGSGLTAQSATLVVDRSPEHTLEEVEMPTDTIWRRLGSISPYVVGDLDLSPPGFEEEGERLLARTWKVVAAQGVLWVSCGIALLAWPDPGSRTLAFLMAVLALADGLISGYAALDMQLLRGMRRWLALEAVVAIALGIALLALSVSSSTTLLYVIAAWALTKGTLELTAARRLPLSGGRELVLHWSGIASIGFGLVMLVEPSGGALALLGLIATFTIVTGVMQVVLALELRSLGRSAAR